MSEDRPGPLAGVRVLDLTRVIVGPYCSQFLGDMGAEVIKVESPEGDLTRSVGPQRNPGMSANFLIFNRNKRSIVLDLKTREGYEALMRLAATCDAFIVNYRPAALAKLKITYADLKAANESIVYCRVVGYGEDNPNAARPAIDDVIQSLSGVVSLQEQLNGQPSYVGLPMADLTCGLFALGGVLGALYRKAVSGSGDEVEVRMYDSMASFVLSPHLSGHSFEPPLSPPIYPRSVSPNRRPFVTADGSIAVAPYTDKAWRSFLGLVDRADLLEDPRYSTAYVRAQHLDELYQIMIPLIKGRSTAEWMTMLDHADVPWSPVQSTEDLVADPALHRAGLLQQYTHPTEGELRLMSNPVRFTEAPNSVHRLPPRLGEDSREVLASVGYDDATIATMIERGITATADDD